MAKVIITLEDNKDGTIKVVSHPTFLQLMNVTKTKKGWTGAQGYAVTGLNAIRAAAQPTRKTVAERLAEQKAG